MTLRVVVVDDQDVIRAGLRALIEMDPTLEVIAVAGDGAAAIELARTHRPDVMLMDIRMPTVDGLEATRRITSELPDTAVVILTTFDLDEYVFEAIRAGACGFLLKDGAADDLIQAVKLAAAGEALMSPRSLRRLIDEFASTASPRAGSSSALDVLTPREAEVLRCVARGLDNREIAHELLIGDATVKTHVANLIAKLHCRNRAQLVVAAYESGLIRPGTSSSESERRDRRE